MTTSATAFDADATRQLIADNLSAEMKRARWSGRQMASALGLTQPYVARRAAGEVECSGSDLVLFANFLDVPVSAFFATRPKTVGGGAQVVGLDALRRGWTSSRRTLDYRGDDSTHEGELIRLDERRARRTEHSA